MRPAHGLSWRRGLCLRGRDGPAANHNRLPFRFSAEGAQGQPILVVPDACLVLVNLAESRDRAAGDWANDRRFIHCVLHASPQSSE